MATMTFFYLLLHPAEAMVASSLEPASFASYMATGAKQGSHEQLIFAEIVDPTFPDYDWDYARSVCDGKDVIKHSCYLGIYRVLERTPLASLGRLFLVTQDGRSLALHAAAELPQAPGSSFLYQELCPLQALAVSRLPPTEFMDALLDPAHRVHLPALAMTRLHLPRLGDATDAMFDHRMQSHLHYCLGLLTGKNTGMKIVDRTSGKFLAYRRIVDGISLGRGTERRYYPLPDRASIERDHYHWGRAANIS